jgi:hypothetical protein
MQHDLVTWLRRIDYVLPDSCFGSQVQDFHSAEPNQDPNSALGESTLGLVTFERNDHGTAIMNYKILCCDGS